MSRQVWNQHAYSIVNINDDLSVPAPADSNWPVHNNFRSGDPHLSYGGRSPDAVPLVDVCTVHCAAGRVQVQVQMGNTGTAPMRARVPIRLTLNGETLATHRTSSVLQPGEVTEPWVLEIEEEGDLIIEVDRGVDGLGRVLECNEDDNRLTVPIHCP